MKKITAIIMCITMVLTAFPELCIADAEKVEGLHEQLSELFMENYFSDEQIEAMDNEYMEKESEWLLNDYLIGKKMLGKFETKSTEEEYELEMERNKLNYYNAVRVDLLSDIKYAYQYALEGKFQYLFSGCQYWAVPLANKAYSVAHYDLDGKEIDDLSLRFGENTFPYFVIPDEAVKFIKDESKIETMLHEAGENQVIDIKLFGITSNMTFLYMQCPDNEYLIILRAHSGTREMLTTMEKFILYPLYEVIEAIGSNDGRDYVNRQDEVKKVTATKPTFEAEAQALQNDGLLYGNENGLDLLKPLTRIEAAVMLLRAIGAADFAASHNIQTFSDVPAAHWGYETAETAYDLGLIKGIGNNMFAPDATVTAVQFAAMLLRAAGTGEFNWEESINLLTENNIITQTDASTMDLFTRGDMAKIIYEAKEKGFLIRM